MTTSAVRLKGVGKSYPLKQGGLRRLRQIVAGKPPSPGEQTVVLQGVDLEIPVGQVVGIVGQNGAGKSTLLKIVAGMIPPSTGRVEVNGRVTALLELGSGFHPEMTGRENVYLASKLAGLSTREIDKQYHSIVSFSGIGEAIERPVKTYSSGMKMRLAFSVATSVDPDVLIIDEALSVGDGIFARKSFERIHSFKESGKTILFCSHSLFQVEAICEKVMWINSGKIEQIGSPETIIPAYKASLNAQQEQPTDSVDSAQPIDQHPEEGANIIAGEGGKSATIHKVTVSVDGVSGNLLEVISGRSRLSIDLVFYSPMDLPIPSIGIVIREEEGMVISSVGTTDDGLVVARDAEGRSTVHVDFDKIPLMKGRYTVDAYLMCERGIHIYERAQSVATISVNQEGRAIGYCILPHQWGTPSGCDDRDG